MGMIKNYIKHFKTITKHKRVVMRLCFKCGLYKRGLLHDLSKYGKTEFKASAMHFNGKRSPIDVEKDIYGYSFAWQHHKGHNPHHWEYWIDNIGTYKNTPIEIPMEYVIEMICDWVGAGIVYSGNKVDFSKPYAEPLEYFEAHLNKRIFHPITLKTIIYLLEVIEKKGVNAFCRNAKHFMDWE